MDQEYQQDVPYQKDEALKIRIEIYRELTVNIGTTKYLVIGEKSEDLKKTNQSV